MSPQASTKGFQHGFWSSFFINTCGKKYLKPFLVAFIRNGAPLTGSCITGGSVSLTKSDKTEFSVCKS